VAKVEDPVVIPKALEEAVLDLTGDWCAERFHGKVISDKKVRVDSAVSGDGVEWKALKPIDTTWLDGPIKVGLVAVNTSSGVNAVRFENYSLKSK
jgi:hypothetical protein